MTWAGLTKAGSMLWTFGGYTVKYCNTLTQYGASLYIIINYAHIRVFRKKNINNYNI